MNKIIIYTDGGSRGNPGPAAIGSVFCDEKGQVLRKYSECIGEATNNEAEYQAVIFAFKKIKLLFGKKKAKNLEIQCRLDSELVAKQLSGEYKIKEPELQPLFLKVWNLKIDFKKVKFCHISRKDNFQADQLVQQAFLNKKQLRFLNS